MVLNAKAKNIAKMTLPLAVGILLLSSCIEVQEAITVHADGSGVVDLSYGIARIATGLAASDASQGIIPLPATPSTFASDVRKVPGLTLRGFAPSVTATTVGANATIDFKSVPELDQVLAATSKVRFTYSSGSHLTTFSQMIYPGNASGVNPQTLALVKQLFGTYRLSFSFRAPASIQRVSIGAISNDKATATYTTTVPAMVEARKPIVWEVSW